MYQKELINDVLINKKFFALAIDQGTSLKEIINQKKNCYTNKLIFCIKKGRDWIDLRENYQRKIP